MTECRRVAIVGAGAAGLMAAARLADAGIRADLFEQNDRPGRKLRISGKGRCNITNRCDLPSFFSNVVSNPKFLYSSLARFSPDDLIEYIQAQGLQLKVERGNRVFPVSDKAQDVIDLFERKISSMICVRRQKVIAIQGTEPFEIVCGSGERRAYDIVLVATGGITYPATGSRGDGYRFAEAYGHTVTERMGVLVAFRSEDAVCQRLQGLTLRNVRLKFFEGAHKIYDELGEVLFTHKGISGPLVLTASSVLRNYSFPLEARIDCKPALNMDMLDLRLLRDFSICPNKILKNSLDKLLPKKIIPEVLSRSGVSAEKPVNLLTRGERQALENTIKNFSLEVAGRCGPDEAVITAGGIDVRQVNPKTMESKLVKGLYFAGEILDVDALTGGYNLQIAFSTAISAADAIIDKVK